VLDAFARRAPGVPVELFSLPAAERLARVAGGRLDAAFVRAVEPVPGVRVRPLWPDPLVTALPASPRDPELKRDLVRRVTDAFVDAYKIPAETVQVWIHEVPADSWGAAGKLTADK
jgi:4-oxalocrotonate tautomerase family enzyme